MTPGPDFAILSITMRQNTSSDKDVGRNNPNIGERLQALMEEQLTTKSKAFISSLLDYFQRNDSLTESQYEYFEKIESRFSKEEKNKFLEWRREYLANHRTDAIIAAKYYQKAGYYTDLSSNIVSDENFVPTKSQYKKITGNKYSQKVIEETNREPKYGVGEQVKIRATVGKFARDSHLRSLAERLCFVLRTDLDVLSAVNGGKRYQVLPMMESTPIEIDERHLKKS